MAQLNFTSNAPKVNRTLEGVYEIPEDLQGMSDLWGEEVVTTIVKLWLSAKVANIARAKMEKGATDEEIHTLIASYVPDGKTRGTVSKKDRLLNQLKTEKDTTKIQQIMAELTALVMGGDDDEEDE